MPAEYGVWAAMWQRCVNPNDKNFRNYGGRGIIVCARWKLFVSFLEDMGPRPAGATIERKDNNGGYEPGNCLWVSRSAQQRNRRNNILVTHNGETRVMKDWFVSSVVSLSTFRRRILRGWNVTHALTAPPGTRA